MHLCFLIDEKLVSKKKQIIGRTDRADFPILEIENLDIKIDTGAYTSSIHCTNIQEENGILLATLLDEAHEQYHGKQMRFDEYEITSVRSSNGKSELRYEVIAKIRLLGKLWKISLTLSNREEMRYPVLIGRKFLSSKFVIDPELQDVSYLQGLHEN